MSQGTLLLAATAATVGVVHTLLGPDHYLPFVVLSRARRWSRSRTLALTAACGLAHVGSSLVLGLGGIALGVAVARLQVVEAVRAGVAGWLLVAVGLLYGTWGLRRALRGDRHVHLHPTALAHAHPHDGTAHAHGADHHQHHHPHDHAGSDDGAVTPSLTPWLLFLVFVLGPCEPLIPLLLVPAAAGAWQAVALVAATFAAATLLAMIAVVGVASAGFDMLPLGRLEPYTHALAGAAILLSGLGMQLLGW